MPYRCSYCSEVHCDEHRLPEAHDCAGAAKAAAARLERQRTGHPGVEIKGGFTGSSGQGRARADQTLGSHEGNLSLYLLVAIGATFAAQLFVSAVASGELMSRLFVLDPSFHRKPWTIVTSVFAHGGLWHLFVNGIVLFFFGPILEKRIGSRRFLYLVAAGGIIAGLTQVVVHAAVLGVWANVVGFSGALMAILGTLTVLNPRVSVLLFFVLPMPLWLMTGGATVLSILFIILNALGIPIFPDIAHMAHLAGLIVGLLVGWRLHEKGYAFPARQVQGGFRPGQAKW